MTKFIDKKESENLEFKKSVGEWKEIVETVTAFSNTSGGRIIVGVSKSGKIVGARSGVCQYITNREYREINQIGKVTAAKELNQLVEKGILRTIGKGRSLKYEMND